MCSSVSLYLLLHLLGYFFISGTVLLSSYFLNIIFSFFLKFSLCSSILFPSSVGIFMSTDLNSLSGKLLISILIRDFFFLEFYLTLSFGTYSSVFSFSLTFSVSMKLGKTLLPSLEGMPLCGSIPVSLCAQRFWWESWSWCTLGCIFFQSALGGGRAGAWKG